MTAEAVKEKLDKDTVDETMVEKEAEDNVIPAIPSNKMAAQQQEDPYLVEIISYLSFGLLPRNRTRARYVKDHSHKYMINKDSILRRIVDIDERSFGYPAMVPWALCKEIVQSLHNHPTNGHRKYEKLLQAFRKAYWFEGMRSFIKNFCDSCTQCQHTTIPKKSLAPLKPFRAGYPGMVLQLDCTPGPKHKKPTERGNSHILAILESFSNHVRLFTVPDPNAKLMAEFLLAYISVHSMPLQIITDNGPEFANQLMTELALMLGLKHFTTSPYNSKANGRVEVAHKSMQTMMCAYMEDHVEDWDLLLPLIEFTLNTSINKGTGYTPFFLHFGCHPIYPIKVYNESVPKPTITVDQYVKQLQRERQNVITWVDNYQKTIAGKRKDKYDKDHRKSISLLKLGDMVLFWKFSFNHWIVH